MTRVFFYFLILLSLKITATDHEEISIEPDVAFETPQLWADPFKILLSKDLKNFSDRGYCGHAYLQERSTTFVVDIILENTVSRQLPKGAKFSFALDTLQYGHFEFILFTAQKNRHMLEIDSSFFEEKNDIYRVSRIHDLAKVIKEINQDVSPFIEEYNFFSCARSSISPIYLLFGTEIIGYNVGGRRLYFDEISPAWKDRLQEVIQQVPERKIRVARFIEDPRKFFQVDPKLVFEITTEEYEPAGELDSFL